MKIKKVEGYEPKYPMKNAAAKVGALAAAALITAGAATGCTPRYNGFLEFSTPQPTEVVELAGEPTVDETEVILDGDVMVDPNEGCGDDDLTPPDATGVPIVDSTDTAGYDDVGISGNIMPDPSGN